jgi:T3SS negative regulator,GrlR
MWTIRFGALDQELGAGILVFETGRAFGGDSCFAYTGNYSVDGGFALYRHAELPDSNG